MNDWLKDIQEKLGNYEVKPSDELARRLESSGVMIPKTSRNSHIIPTWLLYAVPCAALLALVVFLTVLNDGQMEQVTSMRISDNVMNTWKQPVIPVAESCEILCSEKRYNNYRPVTDIVEIPSEDSLDKNNCEDVITEVSSSDRAEEQTSGTRGNFSETNEDIMLAWAAQEEEKPSRKPSLSLAFAASFGSASSDPVNGTVLQNQNLYSNIAGADWDGTASLEKILCSASGGDGVPSEEEYSHHMPLRFGMSLEYRLCRRWSLTSGLNYSYHVSDIYDPKGGSDKLGVQKLSYLGIPLNARFNVFTTRSFEAYLTAGGMAEYCVVGRRENLCDVSGSTSLTVEKYSVHPFQMSLNVSAGIEYSFLEYMSLFAEAGVSKYFTDGSSIQTIYKEKPVNFCANVGVRFKLKGRSSYNEARPGASGSQVVDK